MADDSRIEGVQEAYEKWSTKVESKLAKRPERKGAFANTSGIPLKRLYTPVEMDDFDYARELGFPGDYPYTRGVQPTMYRGRFWTMRQYAGFASAEDTNKRYRFLLEQGQTGSVSYTHLTLPTN